MTVGGSFAPMASAKALRTTSESSGCMYSNSEWPTMAVCATPSMLADTGEA